MQVYKERSRGGQRLKIRRQANEVGMVGKSLQSSVAETIGAWGALRRYSSIPGSHEDQFLKQEEARCHIPTSDEDSDLTATANTAIKARIEALFDYNTAQAAMAENVNAFVEEVKKCDDTTVLTRAESVLTTTLSEYTSRTTSKVADGSTEVKDPSGYSPAKDHVPALLTIAFEICRERMGLLLSAEIKSAEGNGHDMKSLANQHSVEKHLASINAQVTLCQDNLVKFEKESEKEAKEVPTMIHSLETEFNTKKAEALSKAGALVTAAQAMVASADNADPFDPIELARAQKVLSTALDDEAKIKESKYKSLWVRTRATRLPSVLGILKGMEARWLESMQVDTADEDKIKKMTAAERTAFEEKQEVSERIVLYCCVHHRGVFFTNRGFRRITRVAKTAAP